MEDLKVFWQKIKHLYKVYCQEEWNPMVTGIIVAILSILAVAWWRPWGAVGAVRNWGDWFLYKVGIYSAEGSAAATMGFGSVADPNLMKSILFDSGSVIGIAFIAGAFISACLGGQFALRFPPVREYVKAIIAGVLMGIGAALAGGCNVGGMYNAIGNLAANGFTMWIGLIPGVLFGLWLLYKEMEHISWGSGGSYTLEIPYPVQWILGIVALVGIVWWANYYANFTDQSSVLLGTEYYKNVDLEDRDLLKNITVLSALVCIAAALGYSMQRGRWCMIQGFREPHMTGDCKMAKAVALSIVIVAVGAAVLKYDVDARNIVRYDADGAYLSDYVVDEDEPDTVDNVLNLNDEGYVITEPAVDKMTYVRGTFGWGGLVGGFIFGLGAMFAGGCGTGTLWRVGEGQIKLWVVVPFFGIANSLMTLWFRSYNFEAKGYLGSYVYLPDALGYGGTLALIIGFCTLWYLIVTWNEDTNRLILPM